MKIRSEEHMSELKSRGSLVDHLSFPTRRSSDLLDSVIGRWLQRTGNNINSNIKFIMVIHARCFFKTNFKKQISINIEADVTKSISWVVYFPTVYNSNENPPTIMGISLVLTF